MPRILCCIPWEQGQVYVKHLDQGIPEVHPRNMRILLLYKVQLTRRPSLRGFMEHDIQGDAW